MQWIKRAWLGEEKLWKVFWLYLCAANTLLNPVTVVALLILLPYALAGLWGLFVVCYAIWGAAALWQCSFNTYRRFWGYAARVAFVFGLVYEVVTFYSGMPTGDGICNNGYPKESVYCPRQSLPVFRPGIPSQGVMHKTPART